MEGHESDNNSTAGSLVMSGPDMSDEEDDDSRLSNNSRGEQPMKPSIDPEVFARLKAEVASCAFPQKNFRPNASFSPFMQHGMPFGQEELERSLPFFFPSPHLMASHLAAAAAAAKGKDIDRDRDVDSPPLHGYPEETLPANQGHHSGESSTSSTSSQQTWSFEEQFKQLYELSDDIKRKEFLDELFSYMQKRGTPINRLPIMAKQVLDLYELYNLVIARGGLVDVINKKLWQEIIKGLHLPSSITSAAFTLRTQYMKYLYPYECEKKRLSTPSELQAAIDGNRREGRRSSYGPYPDMISPLSLVGGGGGGGGGGRPQMNGNGNSHPLHSTLKFESPNSPPQGNPNANARDALAALELSRLTLWNLYSGGGPPPQPHQTEALPLQNEALNLEVPARSSSEGAQTPQPKYHSNNLRDSSSPKSIKTSSFTHQENGKREHSGAGNGPAPKRHAMEDPEGSPSPVSLSRHIQGPHIKINSRGDGRGVETSLVVSMEINGIMYQGVLFAQNNAAVVSTRVS